MQRVKFITLEQLLEMRANGDDFKLIEVLAEEDYAKGHIPGAINLPLTDLRNLAKERLEKGDTIVIYCADYACQASTSAAKILLMMGYGKTLDFKAGKEGWISAGLKLEK